MINYLKKKSSTLYFFIIFLLLFSNTDTVYPTERTNDNDFNWRTISFPFSDRGVQFVMFDSLNGWALSAEFNQLYQYKNGKWLLTPKPEHIDYYEIYGFSKNNLWVGSIDKKKYRYFLRHFDGQKWKNIYPPNTDRIRDLDYLAPDSIWGACEWGEIIHFDGKEWQLIPSPVFAHLESVTMINDTLGYLTGEYRANGILLKWTGREFVLLYQLNKIQLGKVIMVNPTIGWIRIDGEISSVFLLKNDQLLKLNYSELAQDTINIFDSYEQKSIFFYPNSTVTQRVRIAYTVKQNGEREILAFPLTGNFEEFYLFASDGSVQLVKCKPAEKRANLYELSGGGGLSEYGVAFCDVDSDGDEDIYSVNTSGGNRLQLYGGNLKIRSPLPIHFIEAADRLNILGVTKTDIGEQIYDMGVSAADLDNDGDRDIYITCLYGKNQLHENLSGEKFREIAARAKVTCETARSNVGIWGDIDNDGDVDLFVTNEDTTNMLFLNDGAGQFKEITHQAGLTSSRSGKGATFGDLDLDGDLDLVVPYFCLRNRIYRNEGINEETGLPVFKDVTEQWLPPSPDSMAKSASATLADFDNDGDLDLFIANLVFSNRLYENDGSGKFKDITYEAGLLDSSLSHHGCFFDADNDGDLDLYVTNRGKNLFYENLNGKEFVRDSKIINTDQIAYSTGFACGDPDNDGDIDYYLCNNDQMSEYFLNLLNDQNYLKIKLVGTKSNRDGIGAKTFLYAAGHINEKKYCLGLREINGGYGYGCQNSLVVHYGVNAGKTYDLKVQFPSGIEIICKKIKPSQTLIIEEQIGWEKFVSTAQRTFKRLIKTKSYQTEIIKLTVLFIIVLSMMLLLRIKGWKKIQYQNLILCTPIVLYLVIIFFVFEQGFFVNHFLPVAVFIFSFGLALVLLRRYSAQVTKERLAEELLLNCRAFDHGGWANRPLNRFQLFSSNLLTGNTISENTSAIILDTISVFYAQVYKHINSIVELSREAKIHVGQANELEKNLQQLTKQLGIVKVQLNLKNKIKAHIFENIYELINDVKNNVKKIRGAASNIFSCDVLSTIKEMTNQFRQTVNYPVQVTTDIIDKTSAKVSIKPAELFAIIDNLLNNADRAMKKTAKPSIKIELKKQNKYVVINFTDKGRGITKNNWEKIFDQYYTTKPDAKGGFGLYYSKITLQKYGGNIQIKDSKKNNGTTFLVKLCAL